MPTIPTRSSVSTLLTIPIVSRIGSHPKRPTALTTTQLECRSTFQTSSDDASRTFPQPIWKYERYGFWRLVGWQRTASAQVHFFKQNLCRFTYFFHQDSLWPYGYDYLHSSKGQPQVHFPIKVYFLLHIFFSDIAFPPSLLQQGIGNPSISNI